jgi:8-oxo-dGTP pyrophosphatase MutT (NUDIX family)
MNQGVVSRSNSVIEAAGGIIWRDSPGKVKISIIHRQRYDDWSLPKGKRVEYETWQETALREVIEETGCEVRLRSFAGCVSYLVGNIPKVVLFWNMDLSGKCNFQPSQEVDKLLWIDPNNAIHYLSYPHEIHLIQQQIKLR